MAEEFRHIPVLLNECIENLAIKPDGIYVDGTVGGGGHALHICERLSDRGTLIGIDRDKDALSASLGRLEGQACKRILVQSDYADIKTVLAGQGLEKIDGAPLICVLSKFMVASAEGDIVLEDDYTFEDISSMVDTMKQQGMTNKEIRAAFALDFKTDSQVYKAVDIMLGD
jgi:16S rRNA (cytosine1402-N4)-methyltransferase